MAKNDTKKTAGAAGKALEGETSQAAGAATDVTNTAAAAPLVGASVIGDQAGQTANTSGILPAVGGLGTDSSVASGATAIVALEARIPASEYPGALPVIEVQQDPGGLVRLFDVRVLAPVTIGGVRYQPNTVLEGLPLALVEAHMGSVDPHPEAVDYARANDGEVVQYQGPDQEDEGQD